MDWALVDVETSGLRPGRHRVLSVAVITIDATGECTEEFSTLLDPGCDPGPVDVHGLTPARLRGAPAFEQIAGKLAGMLDGRVMVAHNAQFDYDFLAHEFARTGVRLPVARRLCTLALNRRLGPPTDDLRLGTLAAHYGVPQRRAHDALDDTRVLAGVLRGSLAEAERLELPLPLVGCPPRQSTDFRPRVPKTPCGFVNPGRLPAGGPLTQGMKVAVTGETRTAREELVARAVAAGLNVMTSVSRHTSVLVTNDSDSGSGKARRAAAEGVPVVDETVFLRLLGEVRPGTPHGTTAGPAASAGAATAGAGPARTSSVPVPPTRIPPEEAPSEPVWETGPPAARDTPEPDPGPAAAGQPRPAVPRRRTPSGRGTAGPLAGRRVLVLGGTHPEAAETRARVLQLGGTAAVNLSASVTDVVALPGADRDRRMRRIVALEFPVRDAGWLRAPVFDALPGSRTASPARYVLPRGGVVDLPGTEEAPSWSVGASWSQRTACGVDVVGFVLDGDEQVSCDEDFVFYGAPESPDGAVRLSTDGPTEQAMTVGLATLTPGARRVVVAAAVDGEATFGDVGAVEITLTGSSSGKVLAQATLDAATTERTLLLAEFYRRGATWRCRAVGQGYDHGLAGLARGYGVDVEA
ncbi:DEDDh family exonuclease [Streptomyces sp. NPDC048845]|uniref:DEDDh family exonuclease n=1 Tax=Streptomyces sp. NPDC048845 TaxID=3155390 RepID=UPI0034270A0C